MSSDPSVIPVRFVIDDGEVPPPQWDTFLPAVPTVGQAVIRNGIVYGMTSVAWQFFDRGTSPDVFNTLIVRLGSVRRALPWESEV